ncbi:MAG: hypothetical protein V3U69_02735 [Bacteroidota bacterium]
MALRIQESLFTADAGRWINEVDERQQDISYKIGHSVRFYPSVFRPLIVRQSHCRRIDDVKKIRGSVNVLPAHDRIGAEIHFSCVTDCKRLHSRIDIFTLILPSRRIIRHYWNYGVK